MLRITVRLRGIIRYSSINTFGINWYGNSITSPWDERIKE